LLLIAATIVALLRLSGEKADHKAESRQAGVIELVARPRPLRMLVV
jgi:hypothetical protein